MGPLLLLLQLPTGSTERSRYILLDNILSSCGTLTSKCRLLQGTIAGGTRSSTTVTPRSVADEVQAGWCGRSKVVSIERRDGEGCVC